MLIYLQMIPEEKGQTKFIKLYRRYRSYMFTVARRVLGEDSDAEDAVHQAFLAVIRNLHRIRDLDSPETRSYLAVITERKAIDIIRARRRYVSLKDMDRLPGMEIPMPEDSGGLAQAMARLSGSYREVLLLRYEQGYTPREIAKLLGMKPGSVEKTLWRAKQALRRELEEGGVMV